MKSNGYINVSKLCKQYNKLIGNWNENKSSKELV